MHICPFIRDPEENTPEFNGSQDSPEVDQVVAFRARFLHHRHALGEFEERLLGPGISTCLFFR